MVLDPVTKKQNYTTTSNNKASIFLFKEHMYLAKVFLEYQQIVKTQMRCWGLLPNENNLEGLHSLYR